MSASDDSELPERWRALCEALDGTWSALLDVGGALHAVQKLGLRASHFHRPTTLEEIVRLSEPVAEGDNEPLSPKQRWMKFWCDTLGEAQRELYKSDIKLQEELETMPAGLVAMLVGARRGPWRAHFRRYYADNLRALPTMDLPFEMAFIDEDGLPDMYREASLPLSLPILLQRVEAFSPLSHWQLLIRRGRKYAADLYAIRSEVGSQLPDGPFPPNRWRNNGEVMKQGMALTSWKLVHFLWQAKNRCALMRECAGPVFDDMNVTVDRARIGSHRKVANHFFAEYQIPWKVATSGEYVSLESSTL